MRRAGMRLLLTGEDGRTFAGWTLAWFILGSIRLDHPLHSWLRACNAASQHYFQVYLPDVLPSNMVSAR